MVIERFANNARTVLAVTIGTGDGSLTVASDVGFPTEPQFRIRIGQELLLVTAVADTTWTVTRGIESTTPAAAAAGTTVVQVLTAAALETLQQVSASPRLAGGRLSTESGVSVSSSNRTSQSTIYYVPYEHDQLAVYNTTNTRWVSKQIPNSGLSVVLSGLSAGYNYDIFAYESSSAVDGVAMELGSVWTDNHTRATSLAVQNGVLVKSGDASRRYLGTIRTTGTTTTEDSTTKRFVWNHENKVSRRMVDDLLAVHSYTNASTWRAFNNNINTPKIEWVQGVFTGAMCFSISGQMSGTFGGYISYAINAVAPSNAISQILMTGQAGSTGNEEPSLGYHFAQAVELGATGTSFNYASIAGTVLC
ncbi:MAG: hypothetical protein LC104_22130 [Bacteroidales bacterium]|nr:hypothetical protein [Bacteroidales bacterium]